MSEPGKLFITGMRLVPKKSVSKAVRRLAAVRSKMAVRRFAARYGVDLEDAEKPIDEYVSVLDFFTRRLRPGARPVDPDPNVLVSPVDGAYLVGGDIESGRLFQAKGRDYSLNALLADDTAEDIYGQGSYITLYLAPKDYHRIHSPVDGEVTGFVHVPGALFPVNPAAVAHVHELFARNERLITNVQTERFGRVAVVKVGATNVGHITLSYDDAIRTNVGQCDVRRKAYDEPISIERGGEVGVFEMGLTVILVMERRVEFDPMERGDPVRMGTRIATLDNQA